jgi:hypothetical protein
MKPGTKLATLFTGLLITTGLAMAADAPPQVTTDGLHLVEGTTMARVYAKPGADLSQYRRIHLVRPVVAFTKGWQQQQNRIPNRTVTNDDMQRIKKELADLFMEAFKQELEGEGGYAIVSEVGDDVLVVRPAIVDLNVIAPYTPRDRQSRSAVASAGWMTLYMELLDSVTSDKLVMAIDNKYDRTLPSGWRSNADRNEVAARELLGEWASLLRQALDEARTVVNGD